MANYFKYFVKSGLDIPEDVPCVYQVFFGTKYWIWKGKTFDHSVKTVMKDIEWKREKPVSENDIYIKILQHIKRSRVLSCTVQPLFFSQDPQEILEFEANELEIGLGDMDCLNTNVQLIPKWMTEQPKESALNKATGATILPANSVVDEAMGDSESCGSKIKSGDKSSHRNKPGISGYDPVRIPAEDPVAQGDPDDFGDLSDLKKALKGL